MSLFVDTNVLVYLFDSGSPKKQARAREIFERHGTTGEVILSTQVLQEFYVAVTRKLATPLEPSTACQALRELSALPIVQIDTDMVLSAAQRSTRERLSFWDALVVESALHGSATAVLTEDLQHGQRFDGVEIRNPFR